MKKKRTTNDRSAIEVGLYDSTGREMYRRKARLSDSDELKEVKEELGHKGFRFPDWWYY